MSDRNNYPFLFKKLLQEKNLHFEEFNEDKSHYFAFNQEIKNGPSIRAIVEFNDESSYVVVFLLNYVKIQNPSKRDFTLQLLNELNKKYSFNKFTMDKEGNISIFAYIPTNKYFDPDEIVLITALSIQAAEEEYSQFMRLVWS